MCVCAPSRNLNSEAALECWLHSEKNDNCNIFREMSASKCYHKITGVHNVIFVVEYASRRVQVNQDGLKLNGTNQLLVYAGDVNILGGSVHSIKENAEVLIVASRGGRTRSKCR